tara:strand:- start:335 stop:592 length:258 start_codon:yes stop_codon:yes gene_type:complete
MTFNTNRLLEQGQNPSSTTSITDCDLSNKLAEIPNPTVKPQSTASSEPTEPIGNCRLNEPFLGRSTLNLDTEADNDMYDRLLYED